MRVASVLFLMGVLGCTRTNTPKPDTNLQLGVPAWSRDVVWYQIFVERFRNGDSANDPTPHDMVGVTDQPTPDGWHVTPWGHDWYAQEAWEKATGKDFYGTVQNRRYGGDLQGVLDKLDYLQELGVTALYLNPINDAPSLHKYDARNYHHVDRNFGPDPRGDEAVMAAEDPADPRSWRWTAADSQFLALVKEVHRRGMRVIMDYSWNHTGISFWAWRDVLEHQDKSKFASWYEIERFDDPATRDTNEFHYRGWAGVPWLPEWKKVGRPAGQTKGAIEGNLVEGVRDHIFAVSRRWLDPNGDGKPDDGVDGFRLDVAEMVPLGFWRDYRRFVRGVNPETYLVGEIWWDTWPDTFYDPAPWATDSVFDAVMNYRWFMPNRTWFMAAAPALSASSYAAALDSLGRGITLPHQQAMMNLTASHDTPRFSTAIYNPGKYKYHNRPPEDSRYRIDRPDARTAELQRLILVQQFTWLGAPHIWNGDEGGMWGADDPDERKPLIWSDLTYDDEVAHPLGLKRRRDRIVPDTALLATYRELIALRKAHLRLFVDGEITWLLRDDANRIVAYQRSLRQENAIVIFNGSDKAQDIAVPAVGTFRQAYPASQASATDTIRTTLKPLTASIWITQNK